MIRKEIINRGNNIEESYGDRKKKVLFRELGLVFLGWNIGFMYES